MPKMHHFTEGQPLFKLVLADLNENAERGMDGEARQCILMYSGKNDQNLVRVGEYLKCSSFLLFLKSLTLSFGGHFLLTSAVFFYCLQCEAPSFEAGILISLLVCYNKVISLALIRVIDFHH